MGELLLCQCAGDLGVGPDRDQCPRKATQEDLLCDWCRDRGCCAALLTEANNNAEVPF